VVNRRADWIGRFRSMSSIPRRMRSSPSSQARLQTREKMSGDAIEKCKGASVASPLYLSALVGAFLCSVPAHALASGKSAERPRLELRPGEKYFRINGRTAFVLGRNPVGKSPKAF